MNKIYLATLLFISCTSWAMGNRPPTDPATYQDIINTNNQVSLVQGQVTQNTNQIQSNTEAISSQQSKIDDLSALKIQFGTTVRLYDAKHVSVNFFSFTDLKGSGGNAVGLNLGLKLGKSYEEREIDKLKKTIDAMQALLEKTK